MLEQVVTYGAVTHIIVSSIADNVFTVGGGGAGGLFQRKHGGLRYTGKFKQKHTDIDAANTVSGKFSAGEYLIVEGVIGRYTERRILDAFIECGIENLFVIGNIDAAADGEPIKIERSDLSPVDGYSRVCILFRIDLRLGIIETDRIALRHIRSG